MEHAENRFHSDPDQSWRADLMDQTGTIRVKLGAGTSGSGMLLINDQTAPGIHMVAIERETSVTLKNQSGAEKVISP